LPDFGNRHHNVGSLPLKEALAPIHNSQPGKGYNDTPISKNSDKQSKFQVDTLAGIHVTIKGAGSINLGNFYIGKSGANYNSNYVRRDGENEVYLSHKVISYSFVEKSDKWKDRTLYKDFDKTKVNTAIIEWNDAEKEEKGALKLTRNGTEWTVIAGDDFGPGDNTKIENYINNYSSLKADDFFNGEGDTTFGFDEPVFSARFEMLDGSSHTLILGKKSEKTNKYYCQVDKNPIIFELFTYRLNGWKKKYSDLKAEPKAEGDTALPGMDIGIPPPPPGLPSDIN